MGKTKRYLILLVLSIGAVAIYFMPYLRWTFYDSLFEAVGLSNAQFAATLSIYGVTSMIFYAPGGYLADKFSPRKMLTFSYAATGLLGLWYATYPGIAAQMVIFALWGAIGTAFFWSSMLKVTNSLGSEEEQVNINDNIMHANITPLDIKIFTSTIIVSSNNFSINIPLLVS